MTLGREKLFNIIEAIAIAGADPRSWSHVAHELHAVAPESGFSLLVHSSSNAPDIVAAAAGYDPHFLKSYVEHYHAMNPYPDLLKDVPTGKVQRLSSTVGTDWQRRHPFFHEWLLPAGNYTRGASLTTSREKGGFVRLCFDIPDKQVRSEDVAALVLERVGSHAQRALELNARLADAHLRATLAGSMIEALDCATFVIDDRRHIVSMNARAQGLLRDTAELREDVFGKLSLASASDQAKLSALLGAGQAQGATIGDFVVRFNGRRHLVSAMPIPGGAGLTPKATLATVYSRSRLAIVMLMDLAATPIAPPASALQRLFQLTPAESKAILAMAEGLDTREIAERLGIKVSTARNQLAAAMNKLGVRRQAEALLLLARLSPRLKLPE